jgi:hypothetical protein
MGIYPSSWARKDKRVKMYKSPLALIKIQRRWQQTRSVRVFMIDREKIKMACDDNRLLEWAQSRNQDDAKMAPGLR